ncbi:hypothetical protein BANRA_05032 [Klebsiella pneumoniae]|nr:hypothetical protein BANRA_05032 [Klebsiella pneumoniae]
MTGSGKLLHSLFGISPALGSVLFSFRRQGYSTGLKAIGRGEKFISIGMVVMISVLVIATLLKETTRVGYLLDGNWLYMVPVFNVVAFCFSAQYIVPEMARGFADKPEKLPKAIMVGMALTLLALVPLSVIRLTVWTIFRMWPPSPGRALGEWAFFSQPVCAVRDVDLLLGTGRQLPDQYLRSVPPGE